MTLRPAVGAGLARAFGLGGSQALVRLVCGFVSIKVSAVYLGPSGLALVAQLNTFVTLCQGLLGSGLNTAVVRLGAEVRDDGARLTRLLGTAARLTLVLAAGLALLLAVSAPWAADWLLHDGSLAWVMVLAGAAVAAVMVNGLLVSALNGVGDMGRVVGSNVIVTVLSLAIFAAACWLWGLRGGLVGSIVTYLVALPVTAWCLAGSTRLSWPQFKGAFDASEARRIAGFYPMLLAHAVLTPLATLLVRDAAATGLTLDAAGHWQAAWRLSEVYTQIITTSVSLYFMPRLGQLAGDAPRLRAEVLRTLAAAMGVTALLALVIGLLRVTVVRWVFAPSFAPVADIMPWQLAGDVLKMGAWTLGFVLVSQLRTGWYVLLEVLVPALFYGGVVVLMPRLGVQGVSVAYALASACHLVLAAVALRALLWTVPARAPHEDSR